MSQVNMKAKKNIKVNDRVYFDTGNFEGNYGNVTEVNWKSSDPSAIFGFLHKAKLDDGRNVLIEKSEHFSFA